MKIPANPYKQSHKSAGMNDFKALLHCKWYNEWFSSTDGEVNKETIEEDEISAFYDVWVNMN